MQYRNLILTFLFTVTLTVFFEALISSCASRATPSGGPRDTIAPVLDTAFPPNYSIFFNSHTIELVFNEYLNLKDPGQQIMISPPVENKPDIQLKGKSILIELQDSLLKNTTYTISFGTSVTDYTEGNINKGFRYVFSTGSFIDSLSISGRVYDAYTTEPDKELLVALYEVKQNDTVPADSLPFLKLPVYYTYTDEGGNFKLENLRAGRFRLMAFRDQRNSFKLTGGNEKMAFLDSAIHTADSNGLFVLYSFIPEASPRFYNARHTGRGKVQFNFSRPVPEIKVTRADGKDSAGFLEFDTEKDTLFYWFEEDMDSLSFLVSGYDHIQDTADLFLREFDAPELELSITQTDIRQQDSLFLQSNLPVKAFDQELFYAFSGKDTFGIKVIDSPDPRQLILLPEKRPASFTVQAKPGAVTGLFGTQSDSAGFSISTLRREDLGNLDFSVEADSSVHYVLEIYDAKRQKQLHRSFKGNVQVKLNNYRPGKYQAQLIIDRNDDNRWTPGDYFGTRQPEPIIKYTEPIEIRANWDMELEWQVNAPTPSAQKNPGPLKN